MINYANIEMGNVFTEGFEASVSSGMTLTIGEGVFSKYDVEFPEVRIFPGFEFDLEADDELDVIYDVYLLRDNNENGVAIHVDRTEIGFETMAIYQGTAPLLHCLASIVVPPNTTSLQDVPITIRNITNDEPGGGADEVTAE